MVTPVRAMQYRDRVTGIREVIRPGVDYFAHDHECVRRNPSMFRRAVDPMSAAGRRERIERLKAERAGIQRQRRAIAAPRTTSRAAQPWHLPEPRTHTTGRL